MDHYGKNYDEITLEELERQFREAFLCTDRLDEPLNRELEKMRQALDRKRPVERLYTPEESWAHFLEDNAEELTEWFGWAETGLDRSPARPEGRRVSAGRLLRRALIAAVIVVLLAGAALAADSLGLWAWVPRWNAAAGRYEPAAQEVSGESPIPAALAELGITEPVYPAKLPEGFVITETHISKEPLILFEQYAYGTQHISITITPIKGFKNIVYQKQGEAVRVYRSGAAIHYILSSERNIAAVWYTTNYATTISGDVSLDELKKIIDSIYYEVSE